MSDEQAFTFDLAAEVDRYFDDSSVAHDVAPRVVFLMGGIASGKTTIRKERFSSGYVLVDAAEIFLSLSRGEFYPFPDGLEQPMNVVGGLVAMRAVSERRNVVTELIGAEMAPLQELFQAMRGAGYVVSMQYIECDIQEAWRRNISRGDNNISCHYAEPYQRRWLIEAAIANRVPVPDGAV